MFKSFLFSTTDGLASLEQDEEDRLFAGIVWGLGGHVKGEEQYDVQMKISNMGKGSINHGLFGDSFTIIRTTTHFKVMDDSGKMVAVMEDLNWFLDHFCLDFSSPGDPKQLVYRTSLLPSPEELFYSTGVEVERVEGVKEVKEVMEVKEVKEEEEGGTWDESLAWFVSYQAFKEKKARMNIK